jgi:hypothetical protein
MNYLIEFDECGRRVETYVKEEKTQEQIDSLLKGGYVLVSEDDYQLLLGNTTGKEHIRNPETGNFEELVASEFPEEELAAQIRIERDRRLAETDWYMMPDYPADPETLEVVKNYRKALRDITLQSGFPRDVEWPVMPKVFCEDTEGTPSIGLAKVGIP